MSIGLFVKYTDVEILKVFYRCQISPFFSLLYITCSSTILNFLQGFLKLTLFPLSVAISSGQYLLLKIFYFYQVNVFIACRLSKIYLPSERKAWFYLA